MASSSSAAHGNSVIGLTGLAQLIEVLKHRGFQVIGPVVRDGSIVYEPLEGIEDLPSGWTLEAEPATCRLKKRSDGALFGYVVGQRGLKYFLHPPQLKLYSAERENGEFRILFEQDPAPRYAFIGPRACELAAMARQDRVLLEDRYPDMHYDARRRGAFVVAVQCTVSAATCFCASLGTGPRAQSGFDLALTESVDDGQPHFLVEVGSEEGASVLAEIETSEASAEQMRKAVEAVDAAGSKQSRCLKTTGLKEALYDGFEDPHWDDVAARCLSCGNCTMVCPTCFCVTVEDTSDVTNKRAERWRKWDSCFTQSFSYIHGGSVRLTPKSRYRQWLTHKLAAWSDQFDSLGCVGCGRCITWCPAGIDITEEAAALQQSSRVSIGQA